VVNDGKHAELRNIVLGRDFGSEVEVVSGLTAQDHVMVNPPDSLVQGEVVRVEQPSSNGTASSGQAAPGQQKAAEQNSSE
jgi:hypothetical protein